MYHYIGELNKTMEQPFLNKKIYIYVLKLIFQHYYFFCRFTSLYLLHKNVRFLKTSKIPLRGCPFVENETPQPLNLHNFEERLV